MFNIILLREKSTKLRVWILYLFLNNWNPPRAYNLGRQRQKDHAANRMNIVLTE